MHLFYVLEQQIEREQFVQEIHDRYLEFIKGYLIPKYVEFIGKEIQTAYLESYSEYGQNIFDRYVTYADFWIQDQEYRDPETGQLFNRSALNNELEKIEKPAGISNPKDFRNEIVNFVLRARANNKGKNPNWTSYEKLRTVIEKKMFSNTEDLLPVISFKKTSAEEQSKHDNFVARMMEKGYTRKQVDSYPSGICASESLLKSICCLLEVCMAHFIDRRLNGKNKSAVNRQRFIRRYTRQIKRAVSDAVSNRSIQDIDKGEEISIPSRDIKEPIFHQGRGGHRQIIHPGNDRFSSGDKIERPQGQGDGQGGSGGNASDQGEGQDDFVFHISKDEYLIFCLTI